MTEPAVASLSLTVLPPIAHCPPHSGPDKLRNVQINSDRKATQGDRMGVRFQCPQGHKLHVKAELAGKRGVCPECGVRFIVPSFSGGRAEVAGGAATAPSGDSIVIQTTPAAVQPTAPPSITPPAAALPPVVAAGAAATGPAVAWYVRPAAGGQFGPADAELFRQWIEDGRVAADSWVWRTGWAEWKAGAEAIALFADRPKEGAVVAMTAATSAPAGLGSLPSADGRRAEIKRRKQRVRRISAALALVALAVLVALVVVLVR